MGQADTLLIIDNTNVIYPTGGIYLEMNISYYVEIKPNPNDETVFILWIILMLVFILITLIIIVYLCWATRKLNAKLLAETLQTIESKEL